MNPPRSSLFGAFLALALMPTARALEVFNYSATVNERFQTGTFPTGPVANSSFFLNSYNLSGVGWQTTNTSFAVTMVSPQHFLAAAHAAPALGSSVSFLGADGVVRSYTVDSLTPVNYSAGVASDLVVGKFTATVSPQISHYASLFLGNDLNAYTGLNLAVYGAGGRAGLNSIAGFTTADFNPVNGVTDNLFTVMNYNSVTGGTVSAPAATQGQGGDSSSPSFAFVGGNLALLGIHSAINGSPPPAQTYDTFVPGYIADINAVLQPSGYSLNYYTAVPEPAAISLGMGLATGLVSLAIRRRKR